MTVYSCAPEWGAMLTCIYIAWTSKKGHANVRLELENASQMNLFDEYISVSYDPALAEKVMDAVNQKISVFFYNQLAYSSMSCAPDIADNIYRVMILGFKYGDSCLDMLHIPEIQRHRDIVKAVGSEACHFKEFMRFHQMGNTYIAHVEPRSRILPALGRDFMDRMPSEDWIIVDDTHLEAVIHPKDEMFYVRSLTGNELAKLIKTEEENDEYTDLWKAFFNSIAIKERTNKACQLNHFPLWKRKHAVEFMH